MGYRMYIYPEGRRDEWVGDDHKFYGYNEFDAVKNSFTYLYPFIKEQDGCTWDYGAPEDAYELICCIQFGPTVRLSEIEYATFMDLYLADLERCWMPKYDDCLKDIERIEEYMTKMRNTPGNKIISFR